MSVAKDVTAKYPHVEFYAVSCKVHRDVCAQHTIRGYPTVHAFPAKSETSSVIGNRASEQAIIDALKLDEIVEVAKDRKLVDGAHDTDDEEDSDGQEADNAGDTADNDEDSDGQEADNDNGETEDTAEDSNEPDDTDDVETGSAAKLKARGGESNASKASTNEKGESANTGTDGDEDGDATGTEETDENADSEEGDEDSEDIDPDDSEEDVLDLNKMAPPVGDTSDEDGTGATQDDESEVDSNADSEAESHEEDSEDGDNEEDSKASDDSEEDETGDNESDEDEEETETDEDLDQGARNDAPRGVKGISQAVKEFREENKNGRRPGAGANKGKKLTRDMDKWKELIAKKKQEFEKRKRGRLGRGKKGIVVEEVKEGATSVMKANTPGTFEYKERIEKLLAKINKLRKKRGLPAMTSPIVATKKSQMPLKKEVKEPGFVRKQGEKLPIVKRVFKMSEEEQLILDASLSFMAGLKYGVFMSNDSLTEKQKSALKGWLDLMSVSLPPEWGLHSLIDELNENIDMVSQSNDNLLRILRKHPLPRHTWSPSCMNRGPSQASQGFSCGTWKLLHTATVGIAEQRGGLNLVESGAVDADTRVFSPMDAADTIREYLAHFFGCVECRNHFIAQYDQCSFRRCDRLTEFAPMATAEDWKQLALWLFEVHNDVNVRVAHERIEREMESVKTTRYRMDRLKREDEIKHLYPSLEQCFQCFDENGAFDEANVFAFLERTYWSAPDVTADKLLQYRGEEGSGSGFFWLFVIIVLVAVYVLRVRKVDGLSRTVNAAVVKGRQIGGKKRSA